MSPVGGPSPSSATPPTRCSTSTAGRSTSYARASSSFSRGSGERVGAPLARDLETLNAAGATLIPCGLLALAPLHAASWMEDDGNVACLLDRFEIRYTPSATMQAECIRRSTRTPAEPRLVAVGDPTVPPRLAAA